MFIFDNMGHIYCNQNKYRMQYTRMQYTNLDLPILKVFRNLADLHPRMRGCGSARLRKNNQDKKCTLDNLIE